MTASVLSELPANRQGDVISAVYALERTSSPLPASTYRALAEPTLRALVEGVLAAAGRVLVKVGNAYISGYDDQIAARLASEGSGVLRRDDRAVLTLVLIFAVAIPRAEGRISPEAPWTQALPVSRERLEDCRVNGKTIESSLQRLRDAGIVRRAQGGVVPGPQFSRLTPAMATSLFDELVLLAEPDGVLADTVRRRRHAREAVFGVINPEPEGPFVRD